jgi:hypothetical protein
LAIKNGEEGILENAMEQILAPFHGRLESEKEGKVPSPQRESRERAKKKMFDSQAKNRSGKKRE